MTASSVAQPLHTFKSEGKIVTLKSETQSTHIWVNGEPVFTDSEVVVMESSNEEGYNHQMQVVMPLAAAIEFAKAILAAQEEAEMDAWIDEMYQRHLDHAAMVDDALESEIRF